MLNKFLGLGTGLAMGAALFAAPVAASTVEYTITVDLDGTDVTTNVGYLDLYLGACLFKTSSGSSTQLEQEIACINEKVGAVGGPSSFTTGDAEKVETLNFQLVDDETSIYAQLLPPEAQGGWMSLKTGNLGDGNQYFLIYVNEWLNSYAVIDLLDPLFGSEITLSNIEQISHITVVPLPGAALLFGSALLGGGLMRRRRRVRKIGLPTAS